MYEKFYRLRQRPFVLTPDPDYLYLSRVHQDALAHLRLGLESNAGFIVVTGEVGAGKTTVLQTLLRSLDSRTTVARLVNTLLGPSELLEAILIDFGAEDVPTSKPAMIRDLARFLVEERLQDRRVLVVIDEAQNLPHGSLEELRMLSNLETEKSKLMQIILVGQPELRDRLNTVDLEQLNQRITVRYHLNPLDARDTHEYINHRLRCAAIDRPMQFSNDLSATIHERSGGIPRMINVICDATLMAGYGEDRHRITPALVASVIAELETAGMLGSRTPGKRPWAPATAGERRWSDAAGATATSPVADASLHSGGSAASGVRS
jgi:general secretion pathway protein A